MVTRPTHGNRTARKGKIATHGKVLESEHQSSIPNQRFLTYPDPTQIKDSSHIPFVFPKFPFCLVNTSDMAINHIDLVKTQPNPFVRQLQKRKSKRSTQNVPKILQSISIAGVSPPHRAGNASRIIL
jgi:hypothetical protein